MNALPSVIMIDRRRCDEDFGSASSRFDASIIPATDILNSCT